jgi:3-phenylpropionate/trans-cinnamate dioxygenase ferredoxin reductase component
MANPIVIIGAGQAGGQTAVSLRLMGYDGPLVLVGDEAHPPYERPPLSKAFFSGETALERLYLKKPDYYGQHKIELRLSTRATGIDRAGKTVIFEDGSRLAYDKLVLATGSRTRRLSVPGADLKGVKYLRTIADVEAIKAAVSPGVKVAVVGGGYIGLEVAASLTKLGVIPTVIEALDQVMGRVMAPKIAHVFEEVHRAHGVDIRLKTGVTAFESAKADPSRLAAVMTSTGEPVPADLAIVGIGILPETALADAAGLEIDNGIVVDDCGRTKDPAIFAAGDCTNHPNALLDRRLRLESVQNAVSQGKSAAAAMIGKPVPYAEIPWFWSDQYDLKLQIVGLSDRSDEVVIRGSLADRKFSACYLRGGVFVAIDCVNALRDFGAAKKLIAARARPDPERLADPNVALKEFE